MYQNQTESKPASVVEPRDEGLDERVVRPRRKHEMGMMCWMATEGGRKCPQCGRYAKPETLGNLSFYTTGSGVARISMYGHLPGHGCNKASPQNVQSVPPADEKTN